MMDLWPGVPCFPVLFDLIMALRSTETHDITVKSLALFRPKILASRRTNHITRFVNYYGVANVIQFCDSIEAVITFPHGIRDSKS